MMLSAILSLQRSLAPSVKASSQDHVQREHAGNNAAVRSDDRYSLQSARIKTSSVTELTNVNSDNTPWGAQYTHSLACEEQDPHPHKTCDVKLAARNLCKQVLVSLWVCVPALGL